ncbi:RecB family exonuclease [Actinomycetospora cinnamomea]|uniref:Putative RecB family exonuclease n=1 Tax=Actinomycetospora cinnamomea TaxID=663609 RepID=A0A2U1EUV2_9PSEU|nr:PD-(D/E)XK nuclease family protein [Actinomycetospora cinnamomea]PVZ03689.1 putative RecB family exonuclease [Actinomycetospora cinnamomea]
MSTELGVEAAEAPTRPLALSPSRAADFRRCALLYRFRAIDRLPETPSPAALRGTVVHAVLERLHALEPADRGPATARGLAAEVLDGLAPDERALLGADPGVEALLVRYHALEDPRAVVSEGRELLVEAELAGPDGSTPLRGVLDRLDAHAGGLTVVDYKSGAAPPVRRELRALFGVRFYALLLARTRGVVPTVRLLQLGDATTLTLRPTADELERFASVLRAVWSAIRRAAPTGDFRPRPGPGCASCAFRALCPAQGGTPPPYPGPPAPPAGPLSLPVPRPRTGEPT